VRAGREAQLRGVAEEEGGEAEDGEEEIGSAGEKEEGEKRDKCARE